MHNRRRNDHVNGYFWQRSHDLENVTDHVLDDIDPKTVVVHESVPVTLLERVRKRRIN